MDPWVSSCLPRAPHPVLQENKNASPFKAYCPRQAPSDPASRRPSEPAHRPLPRRRRWKAAAWGGSDLGLTCGEGAGRWGHGQQGGPEGACGRLGSPQPGNLLVLWGAGPELARDPALTQENRRPGQLKGPRTYLPTSTIVTLSAPEVFTLLRGPSSLQPLHLPPPLLEESQGQNKCPCSHLVVF